MMERPRFRLNDSSSENRETEVFNQSTLRYNKTYQEDRTFFCTCNPDCVFVSHCHDCMIECYEEFHCPD